MMPSLAILPTWRVVISRATLRVCIFRLLGWVLPIAPQPHIWVVDPILSTRVVHSGRAMLRRPLGLSQAALARPSHCVHTLWAHIEVITHNAEVVGNKIFKKKEKKHWTRGRAHHVCTYPAKQGKCTHTLVVYIRAKSCLYPLSLVVDKWEKSFLVA